MEGESRVNQAWNKTHLYLGEWLALWTAYSGLYGFSVTDGFLRLGVLLKDRITERLN